MQDWEVGYVATSLVLPKLSRLEIRRMIESFTPIQEVIRYTASARDALDESVYVPVLIILDEYTF